MKIAILQPNYIPWKGNFDMIAAVDHFVLLDTVQFTKRDWRNRNRIKTPRGPEWLTIPLDGNTASISSKINEVRVLHSDWWKDHWRILENAYSTAPAFPTIAPMIEEMYQSVPGPSLADIDEHCLRFLCNLLQIDTTITRASILPQTDGKTGRLISICKSLGATEYLSGPAAASYIEADQFADAGIKLKYFDYSGYPEYEQIHPPFLHDVSVLDPLFHAGKNARSLVIRDHHQ